MPGRSFSSITGSKKKAAVQFRDIKAGGITRDDHEREMFEINDINSNKERSPGGYYPLGIQGY